MNFFKISLFLFLLCIKSLHALAMLDPVYTGDESANNDFYGVNDTGSAGRVLQINNPQKNRYFQEVFLDNQVSVQDDTEEDSEETGKNKISNINYCKTIRKPAIVRVYRRLFERKYSFPLD